MKNIKYIIGIFLALALFFSGCEEENYEFGDIIAPLNITIVVDIDADGIDDVDNYTGDGTGKVKFTANADNAITYKYYFGGKEIISPSGETTINFSQTGTHKYTVTVEAIGTAGSSSTKSIEVEVLALYDPPADLLTMLTGDSEKTWRIKAESKGHFGVGPADGFEPIWWSADPFNKDGVGAYDDRFIFNIDGTFSHITNGDTFGKLEPMTNDLAGDQGREPDSNGEADNYLWDDYSESWELTAPDDQETLTFSNIGYHGFYVGGDHSYQILERSTSEMSLRTIGAGGLAWYVILTSEAPVANDVFTELVWSDEFDTDGAPNAANWTYDLGAGGWGNGEAQTYTNDAENVIVEGGVLKITAKAEDGGYTSARLKSQGLYDFTYGRVDISAKLPSAAGTWPALWMLGANFDTVGWPTCGEIDIMEQTGGDKDIVGAASHWFDTSNSAPASYALDTAIDNASTEFHVYSIEWTEESIKIFVDDVKYYELANSADLPFNADFFLIFNIAMGGTLGGAIDPGFTEDVMEIDYVKVYQ